MKEITRDEAAALETFIVSHDFFFIAGHKEPDGDAICSCLGVAALLEHFDRPYQLLSAGPFKRTELTPYAPLFTADVQFLSNEDRKHTGLIIVDCSELQRLGELNGDVSGIDTYVIDHHRTAACPAGARCYIDDSAPSTANLIQQFYELLAGHIPPKTAETLFLGMCTDTGFFRFLSSADASVFAAAARLVAAGADPRTTYDKITGGKSFNTRKLLGIMLGRAERSHNGKLIVTYETMEDTQKYGGDGRDSDSLYQLLLSITGVEAVVFLRQETPRTCTGGFRSRGAVDVSSIAAKFGGGGHNKAAGMSTEGTLDTLIPAVCKEFARIL